MKTLIWVDPIVKEVRKNRENLARKANYDLKELTNIIKENQKRHKKLLVSKKRPL